MKNNKRIILANRDIRFPKVRVVTDAKADVMTTTMAQQQADAQGLDLVLINASANPPVCRILDLGKYRYELQQKAKDAAKAQRASRIDIKEVQFKPNIDEHDFNTKCKKIDRFISSGNIVKVQVQFKGRERQHSNLGYELINRVLAAVKCSVQIEGKPQFNGNRITAILKGMTDGTEKTK